MEGTHEVGSRPFMPASTLSGRSVALLRVNLDDYPSEGRSISHGNYTRTDNKLPLVATDGRRLALVDLEVEFPRSQETEIIVSTNALTEIQRLLREEAEWE